MQYLVTRFIKLALVNIAVVCERGMLGIAVAKHDDGAGDGGGPNLQDIVNNSQFCPTIILSPLISLLMWLRQEYLLCLKSADRITKSHNRHNTYRQLKRN